MQPLEELYEAPDLPAYDLPSSLARMYDGALGFAGRATVANFVSSLDGVVAIPSVAGSPSVISGKSEADRFVMGLLRACAGAVLVGAGTVRAEPDHHWTPEHVYPPAASDFARLRRRLGLAPSPELAILTASGDLDPRMPVLQKGAVILTTAGGAKKLHEVLPRGCAVVEVGTGTFLDPAKAMDTVRERGHAIVLSEGGPAVIGQLLEHRLLDELFLTFSPMLAGRIPSERRLGLVEGSDLVLQSPPWGKLLSVRRHASHLFARYSLPHRTEGGH